MIWLVLVISSPTCRVASSLVKLIIADDADDAALSENSMGTWT
jgi:hypothetical protein